MVLNKLIVLSFSLFYFNSLSWAQVSDYLEKEAFAKKMMAIIEKETLTDMDINQFKGLIDTKKKLINYPFKIHIRSAPTNFLFEAVFREHIPLVELLLENGAHIFALRSNADTPFNFALITENETIRNHIVKQLVIDYQNAEPNHQQSIREQIILSLRYLIDGRLNKKMNHLAFTAMRFEKNLKYFLSTIRDQIHPREFLNMCKAKTIIMEGTSPQSIIDRFEINKKDDSRQTMRPFYNTFLSIIKPEGDPEVVAQKRCRPILPLLNDGPSPKRHCSSYPDSSHLVLSMETVRQWVQAMHAVAIDSSFNQEAPLRDSLVELSNQHADTYQLVIGQYTQDIRSINHFLLNIYMALINKNAVDLCQLFHDLAHDQHIYPELYLRKKIPLFELITHFMNRQLFDVLALLQPVRAEYPRWYDELTTTFELQVGDSWNLNHLYTLAEIEAMNVDDMPIPIIRQDHWLGTPAPHANPIQGGSVSSWM